jgi:GABA(A) receptor-associated protein
MDNKTFEENKYYSNRLTHKYPDRIPVIIEKNEHIVLENYKYLLPKNITISQFMSIIRTKMNIASKQALFTFVKSYSSSKESYSSLKESYNSQKESYNSQKESYNSQKESYNSQKESYILVPMSETIENIYNVHKNRDGFLYIKFGIENTFG